MGKSTIAMAMFNSKLLTSPEGNFMAQVVQKLIDWGADVNQMRFDTDVGCLSQLHLP